MNEQVSNQMATTAAGEVSTRTPDLIAFEINSIKSETMRMLLSNSIEIGRRLVEAKSLVQHGEWGSWLKEKVDYSKSTANNLMKLFEEYGESQLSLFGAEVKSQTLGNLSYTQAIALLALDESEREEFVKENNVEDMSTRELQRAIKEKQAAEQRAHEIESEKAELESACQSLRAEADRLKDELDSIKENDNSDKLEADYEKISKEFVRVCQEKNEAEERIQELEKSLAEKPIDATIIEVPEDVQRELEELRKQVKEQKTESKEKAEFQVKFEQTVQMMNELIRAAGKISGEEQKYKQAIVKMLEKINETLDV